MYTNICIYFLYFAEYRNRISYRNIGCIMIFGNCCDNQRNTDIWDILNRKSDFFFFFVRESGENPFPVVKRYRGERIRLPTCGTKEGAQSPRKRRKEPSAALQVCSRGGVVNPSAASKPLRRVTRAHYTNRQAQPRPL